MQCLKEHSLSFSLSPLSFIFCIVWLIQKRADNKSNRKKYSPFVEPPSGDHGYPCAGSTMHPGAYGNSRSKKHEDHRILPGGSVSNLKTKNGAQLRSQVSYMPQYAGELSVFNGASGTGAASSQHMLDRPASSHKKNDRGGKDSTMVNF